MFLLRLDSAPMQQRLFLNSKPGRLQDLVGVICTIHDPPADQYGTGEVCPTGSLLSSWQPLLLVWLKRSTELNPLASWRGATKPTIDR